MNSSAKLDMQSQSFTSKLANWDKYRGCLAQDAFALLHGFLHDRKRGEGDPAVVLSRQDVFDIFASDIRTGIVAAIVWGYPKGSRPGGKKFDTVLDAADIIAARLAELRSRPGLPADEIIARFQGISGLGPSTYTKFLYFARIQAEEGPCLIYDQMVMRAIACSSLPEWRELAATIGSAFTSRPDGNRYRQFPQKCQVSTYGAYLRAASSIAGREVHPDVVEFALFDGAPKGKNLKAAATALQAAGKQPSPCPPGVDLDQA